MPKEERQKQNEKKKKKKLLFFSCYPNMRNSMKDILFSKL